MAQWMMIEEKGSKACNLLNLDMVPHVFMDKEGTLSIYISINRVITLKAGETADKCFEFIKSRILPNGQA